MDPATWQGHTGSHHNAHPGAHPGQQPRAAGREVWRGPGDVMIEEGFPPVSHTPARTQPPPLEQLRPAEAFTPAPPEEFNRPQRRMPDVNDFPVVGQREYRAKSNQYGAPIAVGPPALPPAPPSGAPRIFDDRHEPAPAKRSGSLFQRLVGSGGGRHD